MEELKYHKSQTALKIILSLIKMVVFPSRKTDMESKNKTPAKNRKLMVRMRQQSEGVLLN
jgi:hypothetical protein